MNCPSGPEAAGECPPCVVLGSVHRIFDAGATGEVAGDCRSQRAPRTMITPGQALPAVPAKHTVPAMQGIDHFRRAFMRSRDQDVSYAHRDQALPAEVDPGFVVVGLEVGKPPRLGDIRSQYRRQRQQEFAHRRNDRIAREIVAVPRGQHRVEDERNVGMVGNDPGNGDNIVNAAEHSDLEGCHSHVLEQRSRLALNNVSGNGMDAPDPGGVLNRHRGQCRQGMATEAGQGQGVRLNAGAGGGIAGGERQNKRRSGGCGNHGVPRTWCAGRRLGKIVRILSESRCHQTPPHERRSKYQDMDVPDLRFQL